MERKFITSPSEKDWQREWEPFFNKLPKNVQGLLPFFALEQKSGSGDDGMFNTAVVTFYSPETGYPLVEYSAEDVFYAGPRHTAIEILKYEYRLVNWNNPILGSKEMAVERVVKTWYSDSLLRKREKRECIAQVFAPESGWSLVLNRPRQTNRVYEERVYEQETKGRESTRDEHLWIEKSRYIILPKPGAIYLRDGKMRMILRNDIFAKSLSGPKDLGPATRVVF